MKITKGLSTWAGLVTALAQYLAAVAVFLNADDQALALGPLATATLTLYKVLDGRFGQAVAALENPSVAPAAVPPATTSTSGTLTGVTWTGPTPGAAVTSTGVMRDNALDPDPPAGPDPSMANPALDDPDFPAVPTRAEHSGLKG